jgi:hypothetical protein
MADDLGIKRCWFHKGKNGKSHYDIPKSKLKEITVKCEIISSKDMIKIMRG